MIYGAVCIRGRLSVPLFNVEGTKVNLRREIRVFICVSIVLILLISCYALNHTYFRVFDKQNYVIIHLILELSSIVISFCIALQAWMFHPFELSRRWILLGA